MNPKKAHYLTSIARSVFIASCLVVAVAFWQLPPDPVQYAEVKPWIVTVVVALFVGAAGLVFGYMFEKRRGDR